MAGVLLILLPGRQIMPDALPRKNGDSFERLRLSSGSRKAECRPVGYRW